LDQSKKESLRESTPPIIPMEDQWDSEPKNPSPGIWQLQPKLIARKKIGILHSGKIWDKN
jgi:hypothetical protein